MDEVDEVAELPTDERELRFGLVLYGGVSLAIYMHGATKELHRLVRASATRTGPSGTEEAWRALLDELAREQKVRTRVVIDCIAGTSAGGINGVYLAKALAHDLSQDALRNLWFDRGDIGQLLRGPRRLPWTARLPWVVLTLRRWAVLRGNDMAAWLHEALAGMDPVDPVPGETSTLVPEGHPLRLLVTVTDHDGYRRDVVLGDPAVVGEKRHRHVLEFRYREGEDDDFGGSGPLDDVALAFAARATSSFPGAFPPVSVASFAAALRSKRRHDVDLDGFTARWMFRHYGLASEKVANAHFIDGGVLDNRPFGHVIDAIRKAPAAGEVQRRLLYLEPKPAEAARTSSAGDVPAPGPLRTVLSSLVGLPRHEPILDDILEVGRRNERVEQLQGVIRANWEQIAGHVEAALDRVTLDPSLGRADQAQLQAWRAAIHKEASAQTGFGYATYCRVKISDAVDRWAATLCRLGRLPSDCSQASLIRRVLHLWARDVGLLGDDAPTLTDAQQDFLRDFDLGYGERHLRFMIDGLSGWYEPDEREAQELTVPTREQLDVAKRQLYGLLRRLRQVMRGDRLPAEIRAQIDAVLGERALTSHVAEGSTGASALYAESVGALTAIADAFRSHLADELGGFDAQVHAVVEECTDGWDPEARRRLRLRHLGYPVWDAVLFPLHAIAGVGERDRVDLVRLSPVDARTLEPPPGPKLAGTARGNFGAFFTRAGREKDYLWGRLDTAERLVTILLGTSDETRATRERWCTTLFNAILDEEADELRHAGDLIADLRGALPSPQ